MTEVSGDRAYRKGELLSDWVGAGMDQMERCDGKGAAELQKGWEALLGCS